MNNFEKTLVDRIFQRFENSKYALSLDSDSIDLKFAFDKSLFPDYFSSTRYLYEDEILEVLKKLEHREWISVLYDKTKDVSQIVIHLKHINNLYAFYSEKTPLQRKQEIVFFLTSYQSKKCDSIIKILLRKLDENQPLSPFPESKDISYFKRVLIGVDMVLSNDSDILKRVFSQKNYGDSKQFEGLENRICLIIKSYFPDFIDSSNTEILEAFFIYKNPSFIKIKGKSVIRVFSTIIDLNQIGGEIILNSDQLLNTVVIELNAKRIVTIENLTNYTNFVAGDAVAVFLSGYSNSSKNGFLRSIVNKHQNILFQHFGDIDVNGFHIMYNLSKEIKHPIIPLHMGVLELMTNRSYTKSLSSLDVSRLNKLLVEHPESQDVFTYMLENNCKLEQEIIDA
jgi:hypothetical protein